jgi:hypothetical protein
MDAPQIVDIVVEPLYDTQQILAAGSLGLTYFQVPIGQGQSVFGAAGVTKQLADTNMDLAGQLPAGYNFDLLGFRIQPSFTMTGTDARNWSVGCAFTFTIASKPYLRVPADTIPAGMGPAGYAGAFDAATSASGRGASHGAPHISNAYVISKKPLRLSQSQNFNVTLNWVVLQPVTSVIVGQIAAALPVRIYMDGFKIRPVQ